MKRFFWLPLILVMLPLQVGAATLLKSDFNTASSPAWPNASVSSTPTVRATVTIHPVGTVDAAGTAAPSGALLLTARPLSSGKNGVKSSQGAWGAALVSGLLPVRNPETNLGKLTLSFSLSASDARPVTVRVESFNAARRRTGGLAGLIYPAAPDFFQRYALDLSTLKRVGPGKFQPTAPFVQFTFRIAGASVGADWPTGAERQLRLDNVNYAGPAYYVSPKGSDAADGRSEKTAFATPQKALDVAQPGDIVLLMEGTYRSRPASHSDIQRLEHRQHRQRLTSETLPGPGPGLPRGPWPARARRGRRREGEVSRRHEQSGLAHQLERHCD